MKIGLKLEFYIILLLILSLTSEQGAAFSEKLFFIGENLEVLTIASRHPENPKEAPAIAQVISLNNVKNGPFITLADILRTMPGIWIENRENTYFPVFRGITDGFLLLYDGIPLTSDSTKTVYHLGEELNLNSIERIEIVRGPGSVLWGPDAFAGLINIVPKKSGKDNISFTIGSPRGDFSSNFFISKSFKEIKTNLSLYYYGKDPCRQHYQYSVGQREITGSIGREEYYDLFGNIFWKDQIKISGRISKFRRPFVMRDISGISWSGERENPINFLKVDAKKQIRNFTFRTRFYYEYLYLKEKEFSLTKRQKNHLLYGEFLLDKPFKNYQGLITLGGSYRKNFVRNATIRVRGFLPGFLNPENPFLKPLEDIADFDTKLYSFFGQIKYKLNKNTLWVGLRFDDHDQYDPSISYQFGNIYQFKENFLLKIIYGTAYRTPYSAQFLGKNKLNNPEKINSFNIEFSYQRKNFSFFITPFFNKIKHHISEDPFGGYSSPMTRKFVGLETGFSFVKKRWKINGSFSYVNSWGKKEKYKILDYILILPNEEPIKHYSWWEKPFNKNPKYFAHLDIRYLFPKIEFYLRTEYIGPRKFYYLKDKKTLSFNPDYLIDLSVKYKISKKHNISLVIKNLTDRKIYHSGNFDATKSLPFNVFLRWNMNF